MNMKTHKKLSLTKISTHMVVPNVSLVMQELEFDLVFIII